MDELKVIVKAKELAIYTVKVTSNCNTFPKKYRFTVVDKMQNHSLEIYENLLEANRQKVGTGKNERMELQTRAITKCDLLLFYIELAMNLNIINSDRVEYWSGLVKDVKHMTLAWRSKTK